MSYNQVNIVIVGLGFGMEFIPIYQKHPQANMYAICQRTEDSDRIAPEIETVYDWGS
ncbi:hypothetical protein NC796_20865 [Aliifodinibius sp. S!AR15-10]|nr:hypothetical protein [Aliifodinibius sp. S!AR15-10]MDR8393618.1 hypothetical protein [Aliifodinibius sp. S!AR15-10]